MRKPASDPVRSFSYISTADFRPDWQLVGFLLTLGRALLSAFSADFRTERVAAPRRLGSS